MAKAVGMKQVGYVDVAGGGQVVVRDGIAVVGHMRAPHSTTIIDVKDPKNPIVLAELTMAPGTHAHKVRVVGDTMVINQEVNLNDPNPPPSDFRGGIGIYDISNPRKPQLLNRWETGGQGVHRFDLDERYAYLSSTADGYLAHIVIILDLKDPRNPVEVARWWVPGQWAVHLQRSGLVHLRGHGARHGRADAAPIGNVRILYEARTRARVPRVAGTATRCRS